MKEQLILLGEKLLAKKSEKENKIAEKQSLSFNELLACKRAELEEKLANELLEYEACLEDNRAKEISDLQLQVRAIDCLITENNDDLAKLEEAEKQAQAEETTSDEIASEVLA